MARNAPSTYNESLVENLFEKAGHQIETQKLAEAKVSLEKALGMAELPKIHHRMGAVHFMLQDVQLAVESFQSAIFLDNTFHRSYASLAEIARQGGQLEQAIGCWGHAIKADPENLEYLNAFTSFAQDLNVEGYNPVLKESFIHALVHPDTEWTNKNNITQLWQGLLRLDVSFSNIWPLFEIDNYDDFKIFFNKIDDRTPLFEDLFLLGLKRITAVDLNFERSLVYLRRVLLERCLREDLSLIMALAHYCFETEYIFECSAEEMKKVEALSSSAGFVKASEKVALVACYKFLYERSDINDIAQYCFDLDDLIKSQIMDCKERQRISEGLSSITNITQGVSEDVRAQYESFPYPRWNNFVPSYANEPLMDTLRGRDVKMLIAGTGTGREAISVAAGFPESEMTAVDLSRSSLAYASQKAKEYNIKNINFSQGDILELGNLDIKFDYIASSGVLHHMEDPIKGWKVIRKLLEPDGIMRIALYSRSARRHIIKTRNIIKMQGYKSDLEGMREFRRVAEDLLAPEIFESFKKIKDYYSASECRDLLFHEQEHQFDLPEISDALEKLDLEFIKMAPPHHVMVAYHQACQADPRTASLEDWHRFEEQYPDVFISMYQFWCRPKK